MPVLARNVVATSQPLAAQAGPAHADEGRQRGGCGARHRDRADRASSRPATASAATRSASCGTASKLHGLNASGRSPAAWTPDRFKGMTAMPHARLGLGHRSGRGVRLGRAVGALRQAAVRRSVRARDPLRGRRLHGLADDRAPVGEAGAELQDQSRASPSTSCRAGARRQPGEKFVASRTRRRR